MSDMDVTESVMYRTLERLMQLGVLSAEHSFLLVFAGDFDRRVMDALGLSRYQASNVATGVVDRGEDVIDARALPFGDASFDHVVAHAGIHHTSRPHQAVCEMIRVARRSTIFFEAQDSPLMRLAIRLGWVVRYEWNAIFDHGLQRGGVDDRPIPNYVYRWTPREVEKLVRALDPTREPDILFFREWNAYYARLARRLGRTPLRHLPDPLLQAGCWLAVRGANLTLGHWGNSFAACIRKDTSRLQPWIVERDGSPCFDSDSVASPATRAEGGGGLRS